MQFRKLFSADNEQAVRPHQRLGAEYIEGRGLYPERRANIVDHGRYETHYSPQHGTPQYGDRASHSGTSQGNRSGRRVSDRRVTRRRMPLTTLEALVQIKANGLTFENA